LNNKVMPIFLKSDLDLSFFVRISIMKDINQGLFKGQFKVVDLFMWKALFTGPSQGRLQKDWKVFQLGGEDDLGEVRHKGLSLKGGVQSIKGSENGIKAGYFKDLSHRPLQAAEKDLSRLGF